MLPVTNNRGSDFAPDHYEHITSGKKNNSNQKWWVRTGDYHTDNSINRPITSSYERGNAFSSTWLDNDTTICKTNFVPVHWFTVPHLQQNLGPSLPFLHSLALYYLCPTQIRLLRVLVPVWMQPLFFADNPKYAEWNTVMSCRLTYLMMHSTLHIQRWLHVGEQFIREITYLDVFGHSEMLTDLIDKFPLVFRQFVQLLSVDRLYSGKHLTSLWGNGLTHCAFVSFKWDKQWGICSIDRKISEFAISGRSFDSKLHGQDDR